MIKVTPLTDLQTENFTALFKCYYAELGCADDAEQLVQEYVLPDLLAGLLHVDLLYDGGGCIGFVIYQKDDIDNDWNYKEGWGDMREIYVAPFARGRGYGKFLLYTAEMKLKDAGADRAYCLPAENAAEFFTACGYSRTDEYDEEFGCYVYEKINLNNRCG